MIDYKSEMICINATGIVSKSKSDSRPSDIYFKEYTSRLLLLSYEMMIHPTCTNETHMNLTDYILNISEDKKFIKINIVYSDDLKSILNPLYVRNSWVSNINTGSIFLNRSNHSTDELRQKINEFIKTDEKLNKVWIEVYLN